MCAITGFYMIGDLVGFEHDSDNDVSRIDCVSRRRSQEDSADAPHRHEGGVAPRDQQQAPGSHEGDCDRPHRHRAAEREVGGWLRPAPV